MRAELTLPGAVHFPRPWTWLAPLRQAASHAARGERVVILVVACVLMSLGDLYMTLTYVTSVGMLEANPVARALMSLNSPVAVIAWKCALTLFGAGVLVFFRRLRAAELAAWVVFAGMALLTLHWQGFNRDVSEMTEEYQMLAQIDDHRWVHMDGW
jgi:hypothetical protein